MSSPQNPATTTVMLRHRDNQMVQVEGRLIVAGLAITPVQGRPGRYTLTHTGSGLAIGPIRCHTHITQAAAMAAGRALDWTRPAEDLAADPATYELDTALREPCAHCQPDQPHPA